MNELVTTPAQSDISAPAPAPAIPGPSAPAVGATSAIAPQAPATGAAPDVEPSWLRGRLQETRQSASRERDQYWQSQANLLQERYESQINQLRSQVQALAGVTPPDTSEAAQVREQFAKLFPEQVELGKRSEAINQMLERQSEMDQMIEQHWGLHAQRSVNQLYELAEASLGGPLAQEGKERLHAFLIGVIQTNPQMQERYLRDPNFITDVWKSFSSTFIDPVRRATTTAAVQRVPGNLPQDTPSGAPQATPPPKFNSLDERMAAGLALYNQRAKSPLGS